MSEATAASADLERLNPFVGVWRTEGEVKTGPSGQPAKFAARDAYEWLAGGHFLLHRFDADMPEGKVQGIEVVGYSREKKSYPMYSFDSAGNTSLMQAHYERGTWTFVGQAIRFTGSFRDDAATFEGVWERRSADDAPWQQWMSVKLTRAE